MSAAYEGPQPERAHRLSRPVEGRLLGGVCVGLADHLGVSAGTVRLVFIGLTLAGGAGVVGYLFLWALTPQSLAPSPAARRVRMPAETVRSLGVGLALVVLGVALTAQRFGLDLRLGVLLPLLAVAVGAVVTWSQLDAAERRRWLSGSRRDRQRALARVFVGGALTLTGIVVLVTQARGLAGLWDVGVAAVAVLAGVALIAAPWVVRLWNTLQDEQASRVRATERADIAAHLHDSVLQTLALIQRQSHDPATVARLARAQERELRGWLYGGRTGAGTSLAAAVTQAAHEVEDQHDVPVELVVTGDRAMDDAGVALAAALREALLNAVRHGAPPVSAYVEIGPAEAEAFVRDHGEGFDVALVPPDRLGVRESIVGRMHRHGGSATVRRREDGTEVALRLPLRGPAGAHPSGSPEGRPAGEAPPAATSEQPPEPAARHTSR